MQPNIQTYLKHNLNNIVSIAKLAPSAHNSQPWQVKLLNDSFVISADKSRSLQAGDPTGRQTIIGIGIFAETVIIAAQKYDLLASDVSFRDSAAIIRFKHRTSSDDNLIGFLKKRCTDRSVYAPIEIKASALENISRSWTGHTASIVTNTEPRIIQAVADLTGRGIKLALSSPAFRNELADYLIRPMSDKKTGIPVKSMRTPRLLDFILPTFIKHNLGTQQTIRAEKQRWLSASGLVFVTTDGDMPGHWFVAGRAYLRACLAIEKQGLSQATSAAVVEASDFHEDVENLMGITSRIQCVIRIGKGSNHKIFSPRLDTRDIIVT